MPLARVFAATLIATLGATAGASAQHVPSTDEAHRLHGDPKAYAAALDDPARDVWQKPHDVVSALGIGAGDIVADIGSGSGYFALRFANHAGSTGRVYAVDISPDMVRILNRRIRDARLTNIVSVLAEPGDPLLPERVDLVFTCDTWHHVDNRADYLAGLRAVLKPGGRLAIVDFHKRELPVGPPTAMKLSRDEVVAEAKRAGFRLSQEHTFLAHQYFLVFTAE